MTFTRVSGGTNRILIPQTLTISTFSKRLKWLWARCSRTNERIFLLIQLSQTTHDIVGEGLVGMSFTKVWNSNKKWRRKGAIGGRKTKSSSSAKEARCGVLQGWETSEFCFGPQFAPWMWASVSLKCDLLRNCWGDPSSWTRGSFFSKLIRKTRTL